MVVGRGLERKRVDSIVVEEDEIENGLSISPFSFPYGINLQRYCFLMLFNTAD